MPYPLTDSHMAYDRATHRYRLTELYVLQVLNRNLHDVLADNGAASDIAKEPGILLDRISRQVYAFCMRCTATPFIRERRMALEGGLRSAIMDAMSEQLIYVLNNGDLSAFTGVNVDTGAAVDAGRMRQAEIAPMAKDILAQCGLANVIIDPFTRDIEPDYEGEGY